MSNHTQKGFSLKVMHIITVCFAVIIAGLLVFSTYQSSTVFTTLDKATGNYIVRQKAAHDLMEASDYLTEMVQRFTLEGDTQYLNNYFDEAFVSRRRESSITAMAESDTDQSLIDQVQKAMDESTSLMLREYYAMKLVIDAKAITNYPETLSAIELKNEDSLLSPDAKMKLAQEMVMGSEYYARKEIIRTNLKAGLEALDKQMSSTRQETSAKLNRQLSLVRIIVICVAGVVLILIALTSSLGTIPLLKAYDAVRKGRKLPLTGSREYREVADNYNRMYEKQNPGQTDAD